MELKELCGVEICLRAMFLTETHYVRPTVYTLMLFTLQPRSSQPSDDKNWKQQHKSICVTAEAGAGGNVKLCFCSAVPS